MPTTERRRFSHAAAALVFGLAATTLDAIPGQDLDEYLDRASRANTEEEWWSYGSSARDYAIRHSRLPQESSAQLEADLDAYLHEAFRSWRDSRETTREPGLESLRLFDALRRVDSLDADSDHEEREAIWDNARRQVPALETVIELESARVTSRRKYDHESLRRITERNSPLETASYLNAPWLFESSSSVRPAVTGRPDGPRSSDHESYAAAVAEAQGLWNEAEADLLAERLRWEEATHAAYSTERATWQNAFSRLSGQRQTWEESFRELVSNETMWHEQQREAFERQRAVAADAEAQAIRARRSAADERLSAAVNLYRSSRAAERTARTAAELWTSLDRPESAAERDYWEQEAERHAGIAADTAHAMDRFVNEYHGDAGYGPESREIARAEYAIDRAEEELAVWEHVRDYARTESPNRETAAETAENLLYASEAASRASATVHELSAEMRELSARIESLRTEQRSFADLVRETDLEITELNERQRAYLGRLDAPGEELLERLAADAVAAWTGFTGGGDAVDDADALLDVLIGVMEREHDAERFLYFGERQEALEEHSRAVFDQLGGDSAESASRAFAAGDTETALRSIRASAQTDSATYLLSEAASDYPHAARVLRDMLRASILEVSVFADALDPYAGEPESNADTFARLELQRIRSQLSLELERARFVEDTAADETELSVEARILLHGATGAEDAAYGSGDVLRVAAWIDELLDGLPEDAASSEAGDALEEALSRMEREDPTILHAISSASVARELSAHAIDGWRDANARTSARNAALRYEYLEQYVLTPARIESARERVSALPAGDDLHAFLDAGLHHELDPEMDSVPVLQEQYLRTTQALLEAGSTASAGSDESLRVYRREREVLNGMVSALQPYDGVTTPAGSAGELFAAAEELLERSAEGYAEEAELRSEYDRLYSNLMVRRSQLQEALQHDPEEAAAELHEMNHRIEQIRDERASIVRQWEGQLEMLSDEIRVLETVQSSLEDAIDEEEAARHAYTIARSVDVYARSFSLTPEDVEMRYDQAVSALAAAHDELEELHVVERDTERFAEYTDLATGRLEAEYLLREVHELTRDIHEETEDVSREMQVARDGVFRSPESDALGDRHDWFLRVADRLQEDGSTLLNRFSLAMYAEAYGDYEAGRNGSESGFMTPERIVSPVLHDALTRGGAFRSPTDLGAYILEEGQAALAHIEADQELRSLYRSYRAYREESALQGDHLLSEIEYLSAPATVVAHAMDRSSELARRSRRSSRTLTAIGMGFYFSGLASFFSPPLMATLMLRSTVELSLAAAAGRAAGSYEELHDDLSALGFAQEYRESVADIEAEFRAYASLSSRHAELESRREALTRGGLSDLPHIIASSPGSRGGAESFAVSLVERTADNPRVRLNDATHDLFSELQRVSLAFRRDEDAFLEAAAQDTGNRDPAGLKRALLDAYERFPQELPFHHQSLSEERIATLHEYYRRRLDERDEYDRAAFRERTDLMRDGLAAAARQRHAQLKEVEDRGRQAWQDAGDELVSRYADVLQDRAHAYERTAAEYELRHEQLLELRRGWTRDAEGHESPDRLVREILSRAVPPVVRSHTESRDGALHELVDDLSPAYTLSRVLRAARENLSLHDAAANRDHEDLFDRTSVAAGRPFATVSEVEILRHVQETRSRGDDETARRLSLVHSGHVISELNGIRNEAMHMVDSANAAVAESIHRTFTRAGFRREADSYVRDTLVGNTMQGSTRERHRIRPYRAFRDFRFDLPSGTSLHSLAASGSVAVSQRVAAAQQSVATELERIFGSDAERSGGGRVDPDAATVLRRSLERGWLAELIDYGDEEEVLHRDQAATLMPGAFGAHVGYAPELFPRVDTALGWRGNIAFRGRGELHSLYGPFMYYQSLQGLGYGELQQGFHNVRLWDAENAFSISDVLHVGAGVAGGFMSAGASLALSLGTSTLTSALDVVSGEADASEAALRSLTNAASVGIGSLGGSAGSRITGAIGRGWGGELASTAGELAITNTGRSAVYALGTNGFSTERFLRGIAGPDTIARTAGRISGSLLTGDLNGFSAADRGAASAVAGGVGSAVEFGLQHGLTGSATLNVLNFADLTQIAGIQGFRTGASAGLAELNVGGTAAGIRLGSGGIDASARRFQVLASGLPVYAEQLKIAAHALSRTTVFAPDYEGTRSVGTALRSLYSFGSEAGERLYSDVLSGAVTLSVGTATGTVVAERVRDATADVVHLASLGDRGVDPAARASRLFAGLALEHESHRDGRVRSQQSQVAETVNAVRSRLDMADRMMADYGVELSQHELTVSELLLFRMAEELGNDRYFNDFVELVYGSDKDYFFLPVLTGGETQTSGTYADVALLSGYSREEVERLNNESLDNAWQSYTGGQVYEHLYSSREAFGAALRADPDLANRYGYTHRRFISIRDYGCVLFSMAYMLRTATEEYHSVLDINAALVDQGLFINRTMLSSDLIADALNLLSGDDVEFELVSQIARPSEQDFLDAHYSDEEYMGLVRIAAADHVGSDTREAHGIHSEALRSLNLEWDDYTDGYRVSSVNTANPYTGSYAHSARTEREIDEFSRLDLFRVVRHSSAQRIPVLHHAYRSAGAQFSAY
ncbi:MAG: hypothetical protein ACLFNQ_00535 [Spirochaetaceae bacterium]